jgi:serine/threonine-protein kinase
VSVVVTSPGWHKRLEPGAVLRFGRGLPEDGIDLTLCDDRRLHRHSGTIGVVADGWTLTNTGARLRLLVRDREGVGRDELGPGEHRPIPWRSSVVEVVLGSDRIELRVDQVDAPPSPGAAAPSVSGEATVEPFTLDRDAAYFRTLVALCEPRLLDPHADWVPSDAEVAVRLNRTGGEDRHATARAIERRVAYLRSALALRDTDEFGRSVGLERRHGRVELVEVALATGVVDVGDLARLDATPPSA